MNRSYAKSLSDLAKEMKSIQNTITKTESEMDQFFQKQNFKLICNQLVEVVSDKFEKSIQQIKETLSQEFQSKKEEYRN
jgi:hypothetical protein